MRMLKTRGQVVEEFFAVPSITQIKIEVQIQIQKE